MNCLKFYVMLFSLYSPLFAFNQKKTIAISGVIKDSAQQYPLPYATVSLLHERHPQHLPKTTSTNDRGEYRFAQIDTGTYLLTVSNIGYKEYKQNVKAEGLQEILLPPILLVPAKNTLSTVMISAKKHLVQQENDKIIFNVEDDPTAKGESAIDVFRKVPFVSVDGEDNIRLNGQTNFKVLLNGRETSLFAKNIKEALKGFPGALITKIEVITAPSAKYDAEGVGGIINIVTKKKVKGYNAYLNAYYNTNNFYGCSANLNVKFGKIGITAYYGASQGEKQRGTSYSETVPLMPTVYLGRFSKGDRLSSYFWHSGNVELSWDIDSLNTFVLYGNAGQGNSDLFQNYRITTRLTDSLHPVFSFYTLKSDQEYPNHYVGIDFTNKFRRNPERSFELKFFRDVGRNLYLLNSEQSDANTGRFILNNNIDNSQQYTVQADFALPFNSTHAIEFGAKSVFRSADADFNSRIKYDYAGNYIVDADNSDYFDYSQDVYSGYFMYGLKIKQTSFRLGARVENTHVEGNFVSSHSAIKSRYVALLPNLQFTQKFSNTYTTVLSYNKRLQRPYISSLNPFINNSDSLNIFFGNPQLAPQTIHNLSWQHRVSKGSFFGGLTFTGAYSNNMIIQYSIFDRTTGITSTTSANLGQSRQLSANANINVRLNANWNLSINCELRHNRVQRKVLIYQLYEGFGGNSSINTYYRIGKKLTVSANAGFLKLPVSVQVQNGRQYWYSSNAALKMFKQKVVAALTYANFLNRYFDNKYTVSDLSFRTMIINTVPFRRLNVSLTWNFGKLTDTVSKKKGVSNDDLIPAEKSSN